MPKHDGLPLGVERVERGDDVWRRRTDRPDAGPQVGHHVAVPGALDDDRRRVRLRADAHPLGADDEHVRRAQLAHDRDERRPADGRPAGEDHLRPATSSASGARHQSIRF